MDFDFKINLDEVSSKLGQKRDAIEGRIQQEVANLSISTHAFVVNYAQEKLKGFQRQLFFGKDNSNVRWQQISEGMWVVEIDESVRWIEEGRDRTFMGDWLLKPGAPGVKTAKDGSQYRVIPMGQAKGAGGKKDNSDPFLQTMIKGALKNNNISLNRIEKGIDGKPKLGVLHKLDIKISHRTPDHDKFFSKPRTPETAKQIGLKPHSGHFFLSNAVVLQREVERNGKKSISKEVVTFRVISSKHKAEGRWFYPRVEALNAIPEAFKYAEGEWERIVKSMEAEFNKTGEMD